VAAAPLAADGLVAYRTQSDADAARSRELVAPGRRLAGRAERAVFYTSTTSDDALGGLRVRWTSVDGKPALDVDTGEGGAQLAYES